jgi:hypothetical protein
MNTNKYKDKEEWTNHQHTLKQGTPKVLATKGNVKGEMELDTGMIILKK